MPSSSPSRKPKRRPSRSRSRSPRATKAAARKTSPRRARPLRGGDTPVLTRAATSSAIQHVASPGGGTRHSIARTAIAVSPSKEAVATPPPSPPRQQLQALGGGAKKVKKVKAKAKAKAKAKVKAKAGVKVKAGGGARAALARATAACSTDKPFDAYWKCLKAAEAEFLRANGGKPKPVVKRLGTMAVTARVHVYSTGRDVQVPASSGTWTVWAVDEDHLSMGVRTMGLAILPPGVTQLPPFAAGAEVGVLDVDDGMVIATNRLLSVDAQDKLVAAYVNDRATAAGVPSGYVVSSGWGDGSYAVRRHANGGITVYFGEAE